MTHDSIEAGYLRKLDRMIWALIAAVAAIVFAMPLVSRFQIAWPSFVPAFVTCLVFCAGAYFYRNRRRDQRIASGLECTAQLIAFTTVGAPLSYLAAAAGAAFPLQDAMFDAIDRSLGLDWRALLAWMNAQTFGHFVCVLCYISFAFQVTIVVIALAFCGQLVHLRIIMLALASTAIVCIVISALLPAEGVWGYYKLTAADYPAILPATREIHLPVFHGLRDGSMRMLHGLSSEGIITFPSFHAGLAVIFIAAAWRVPMLRWIGLVVNVLMIVATPIDGGHYFIDVPAGIAIAVACLLGAQAVAARGRYAPAAMLQRTTA